MLSYRSFMLLTGRAGARLAGLISGWRHITLCGRLLVLCLASICVAALAEAQPCPATFAGWVNIGTGSCVIPGLGTISNVRFSISGASSTQMSIYAGQAALAEGYGAPDAITPELDANNYGKGGTFGSTAGFNLAYEFTPEPGVTVTGLALLVGQAAFGSPGGRPA